MVRLYAWASRGKDAVSEHPAANREQNVTLGARTYQDLKESIDFAYAKASFKNIS
jgi:hypothetical protein